MTSTVRAIDNPVLGWMPVPVVPLSEDPVRLVGRVDTRVRVLDVAHKRGSGVVGRPVLVLEPSDADWTSENAVRAIAADLANVAPSVTLDMLGTDAVPARTSPFGDNDAFERLGHYVTFQPTTRHGDRLQVVLLPVREPLYNLDERLADWFKDQEQRRITRAERADAERYARRVASRARTWALQQGIDAEGITPAVVSPPDLVHVRIDVLEALVDHLEANP